MRGLVRIVNRFFGKVETKAAMQKQPIKVLIIDDSAFMRKALSNMIQTDPELVVVGTARDGAEGIEKIQRLRPDLVTLDVDMPRMNGLAALKIIMETMPLPVLMVSSLTDEGAKVTLDALDLGAVDFIPKNLDEVSLNITKIKADLLYKIKAIACSHLKNKMVPFGAKTKHTLKKTEKLCQEKLIKLAPAKHRTHSIDIVSMGVSTGGPKALQDIIPVFPEDFPVGIVVVQHMPEAFINLFAQRLDQICKIKVKVADEEDVIKPGVVLIAPGNRHMTVTKKTSTEVQIALVEEPRDKPHIPSVDVLFTSVAKIYPGRCIGVILTGMGQDGKEGMRAIKQVDGKTIAQDEESSVVFGMPKAAIEIGIIDRILPLQQIPCEIINMV